MSFAQVNHLTVKYGDFTAVDDLSFSIPEGEVFGFIGPNGAGKSSTIRVLATLLKPTRGVALIGDVDVVRRPDKARRLIGYMPDFFGVYDELSVGDYLNFFAAAYGLDGPKRAKSVDDVLELTDMSRKKKSLVSSLSRGMTQRLGLARLLLHDPPLLLLDEPASGLDPRARIEMRELLKELRNLGKTILISSHILSELSELCTKIGIIEKGRMVAEGGLSDIFETLNVKRLVHVQITNLSDDMLTAIRRIEGIDEAERQIDRLAIRLNENALALEDLLDKIRSTGARVRMFQPEAMDMESAFMKLTQGDVQ